MASVVKIKRSAIPGRAPNTSILSTGELALNLADKKLYSSDGSAVFEIGANVSSLTVNNYSFPLTDGANGQVLVTDGSGNLTFQNQSGGSGGGASVTTGTTPPSSPSTGDLWFDTDEAILYVYLDGAWVQSVPGSTGGGTASVAVGNSAPSTASEGDMWYDTDVAHLFFYIGTQWVQITSDSASGGGATANLEGYTTNTYITSTYVTNTAFQSYVANTNPRFAQYLEVANANFDQYLQVANSTNFLVQADVDQYLQVANSTGFLVQTDVDKYLEVANSTNFLVQADVDGYLQVANVSGYGFATETYVDNQVAALVNAAPTTLNTLDELAQALGDDANFATSVTTTLGTKASNTYVNTLLANTNSYIASVSDAQSQYLQVANTTALLAPYMEVANVISYTSKYLEVANVESGGASIVVSNTAPTITSNGEMWWDNSTGELFISYANNWVEAVAQDITPYTNNASYTSGNTTLTFVRTDGSQYEVSLDLSGIGGEVSNAYLQSLVSQYLQVANSTNFLVQTDVDQYLQVANSTNFLVQTDVDQYLQVANLSSYGYATESYVDTSVAALVNSAPTTLNTLDELASALGDDANFATSIATTLGTKASNSFVTSTYVTNTDFQSAISAKANTSMLSAYLEVANAEFGGASVTVQNTSPTITANGDLWWDNSTGELYVAYANNWVEAVAQDITPYTNNATYDSGTITFVRTDASQYNVTINGIWYSNTSTSTSTSEYVIDTLPVDSKSAMYYVEASDTNGVHMTTINIAHHNGNVVITEYGTIHTNGELATYNADANTTHVRLLGTPTASGIVINTKRINF